MSEIEFDKELTEHVTNIPGLVWYDIPLHRDSRGWFKENWQREKMLSHGLPDFGPVQNNISYNEKKGVTRGIHAEPWDKYISIGGGRVFGAWVDLREGNSYGQTFTLEMDPSKAIFVPRGIGNAYQALEDNSVYTYLVNDHWSAENKSYAFLNLADPTAKIDWPIPLDQAELSEKDRNHPFLDKISPLKPKRTLIIGANGQLGKALQQEFPNAECVDRDTLDVSEVSVLTARNWREYGLILNAAAYTSVDSAESAEGRINAWKANAVAPSLLARISNEYNITIVHVSSDYVFDGSTREHSETETFSPLGVYGQSKAAGDVAISISTRHYIVRTSWVIGAGNNFVRTMKSLAEKGIKPNVVNDQIGRLTFTEDLAKGIRYLIESGAEYGTYNLTNDGESVSWADIAAEVYIVAGHSREEVTGVSTVDYYAKKDGIAPRPLQSTLNLDKIKLTGFMPRNWQKVLTEYLNK